MMIFLNFTLSLFTTLSHAQTLPEVILQVKDWTAVKEISQELGSEVCMATTQVVDTATNLESELRVVKIKNSDGTYSSPFVLVTSQSVTSPFYKGTLKTNGAKAVNLTLLQGAQQGTNGLMNKYADGASIINNLKAASSVKVDFMAKAVVSGLAFSLSGSSKTINAMDQTCQ